ncbi:hypothetical protein [Paraburkholderia azotifigens]|uniref:Uncharacterized protein n=1 Tax=Paraburkholderia azotifigens TaxID=2057004 RepID=A0A5C6V1L0_9BURK|nr:hypothetical protein [Paraburkholderia azotifigens]TXC79089.1 hypothetical protein FRZ40_32195 [Paraburkholderia azotifigens]
MTLWADFKRQSTAGRREMVARGTLVKRDDFCLELGVSTQRLKEMLRDGDVFELEVDGVRYIPALLADKSINLRRLHSVCRILVPAPPASRLNYLVSKHGNLGGISPIDSLSGNKYRWLRKMAWAWASDYSMTTVQIFSGDIAEVASLRPIYTAALKIDPRANLWKRMVKCITQGGYIEPSGPYPYLECATAFVTRSAGGRSKPVFEVRVGLRINDGTIQATINSPNRHQAELRIPVAGSKSIVNVVHRIAAYEYRETAR